MDTKDKIRKLLREQYGEFNSYLEQVYEDKMTENLSNENLKDRGKWATYNQLVIEIKNTLNDLKRVQELQYKLTDDIDPNTVCIEILDEIAKTSYFKNKLSPELERLYYKIKNF